MSPEAADVALRFAEALNRHAHDEAAALLADDAEVVSPGGTLRGRDVWLESRRRQPPPAELSEEVVADELTSTDEHVELRGRLVQRWVESGEIADEMPVRVSFTLAGGLITRLELRPDKDHASPDR